MATSSVDVNVSGPFFNDPNGSLRRHAQNGVQQLAEMGEERLAEMLRPRPAGVFLSVAEAGRAASKGHYRANLNTMVGDLHAVISDGGVVYGPWLEGVSSRNQTTRFKGYASFRRTGDWLETQAEAVMRKHVQRFIQEMNS